MIYQGLRSIVPIDDSLPEEQIMFIEAVHQTNFLVQKVYAVEELKENNPWYADFVNYLACGGRTT